MAMIQCPECKQQVSDQAPTCPNCGAPIAMRAYAPPTAPLPPPPKKTGCLKIGCIVLAVLVLIGLIGSLVFNGVSSSRTSSTSTSTVTFGTKTTPATSTEPAAPESKWTYNQTQDTMAKGTVSEASVESTNTVEFTFPYQGEQHGTLTLRTHPRYGKNLLFNIQKGQIPCHSFSGGCKALVRFDDGQSISYSADGPEDNSTETIFIRDYNGFVNRMLKAKSVKISVNVYQQGSPVFEFDVRNFDPGKYKVK